MKHSCTGITCPNTFYSNSKPKLFKGREHARCFLEQGVSSLCCSLLCIVIEKTIAKLSCVNIFLIRTVMRWLKFNLDNRQRLLALMFVFKIKSKYFGEILMQ